MLNTFQAQRPETMEAQIFVYNQITLNEGRKKSTKWIVSEIQYYLNLFFTGNLITKSCLFRFPKAV